MIATATFVSGCSRAPTAALLKKPALAIAGSLKGTDPVVIPIDVAAGEPIVVRIDRKDFAPRVELASSSGKILLQLPAKELAVGSDYLYWEPTAQDRLQLRIRSEHAGPLQTAGYAAEIFRVSPNTIPAIRNALRSTMRAGSADAFRDTAEFWRSQSELRLAAECDLEEAAIRYGESSGWAVAARVAESAARSFATLGLPMHEADARLIEGGARLELARESAVAADFNRAERALARSRALYLQQTAPVDAARVLRFEATGAYYRGNVDGAISAYEQSARELAAASAVIEREAALRNLAMIRLERGDYRGAAAGFSGLIAATTATRDRDHGWAATLQNGALAMTVAGRPEQALLWLTDSLSIAAAVGDIDLTIRALTGIGAAHLQLGQPDLALPFLLDAAKRARAAAAIGRLGSVHSYLGEAYSRLGDRRSASAARRTAVEAEERAGTTLQRAASQTALALDLLNNGETGTAVSTFSKALALPVPETHFLVARALVGRARAFRVLGNGDRAERDLDRAVGLSVSNDNREEYVAALLERAALQRDRGHWLQALAANDQAITAIETVRATARNPDNRLSFAARMQRAYRLRIDLLAEGALRARAAGDRKTAQRLELEALFAADDLQRHQLDLGNLGHAPVAANASQLEELYASLEDRRFRLDVLAERGGLRSPAAERLTRETAELRSRLAQLGLRGLPDGRSETAVRSVPALALLQSQLPSGSALRVYALGAARSWAWTLTRERFAMTELPPQAQIDRAVQRVIDRVRELRPTTQVTAAVSTLSRLLRPAGADAGAPGAEHIYVVADGSLGAVPWALLEPAASVVNLTAVSALLGAPAARPRATIIADPRPLRIALFGDPIFAIDDARVRAGNARHAGPQLRPLSRLPGSAREIETIAALAGSAATLVETGERATRAAVMQLPAGSIDILHLATHASLDTQVPQLASLVLSRWDTTGQPLPGNLRIEDIRALATAPRLVVLSACDTAAAPATGASGLRSLAGAFLNADTHAVVASLWPVADASAVEFMSQLYTGLLRDRLTPEAALVHAQRTMAGSARWSAPFHWAGFTLLANQP